MIQQDLVPTCGAPPIRPAVPARAQGWPLPPGAAMDPSALDTLARSFHVSGSRRRLLRRLVASLPLLGALAVVSDEEGAAERPIDRLQRRTQQRNRKQRNKRRNNQN